MLGALVLVNLLLCSPGGGDAVWHEAGAIKPAAWMLLAVLDGVAAEGLDPEVYHRSEIARGLSLEAPSAGDLARMDTVLTDSLAVLISHQHGGRVDPLTFRKRRVPT